MRAPLATAFAIGFGLIVLIGYLVPAGSGGWILDLRTWIVNLAVTLAAFAALVAILGLMNTHWRKLRARRNPDRYSILVLIGFAATFLYGVYAYGVGGPSDQAGFQNLVNGIQIPIETSLMAAVAIVLTLACFRLLQRRRGLLPIVFVISVLAFLLLSSGLLASQDDPLLGTFLSALQFLPVAGGRGILLGIALGSLMAGLRILFGVERPYSG